MSTPTDQTGAGTKRKLLRRLTPELQQKICASIEEGLPLHVAASANGVAPSTFWFWNNRHPTFRHAVEAARAKGIEANLKIIQAARTRDWRAAAWLLEHSWPSEFAKSRVQVEHVGKVEHSFTIPRETLDQIAEARKQHEKNQTILIEADRT